VLDDEVFSMTPDGKFDIIRDGPWVAALAGIRFTLDERFGHCTGDWKEHRVH
jgi:hypothetical protein